MMNSEEDSVPSAKKARSDDGTPVLIPAVVSPDVTEEAVQAPGTEDDQESKLQQANVAVTDPTVLLEHYNVLLAKQASGMPHAHRTPKEFLWISVLPLHTIAALPVGN